MKLIQEDSRGIKIEFSVDELELLNRVIAVPLSAFGLDELLEKTKLTIDEIRLVKEKIQSAIDNKLIILSIDSGEYNKLKNIFAVACEIVDPHEIHALTAYSWDDALKLQRSLAGIK